MYLGDINLTYQEKNVKITLLSNIFKSDTSIFTDTKQAGILILLIQYIIIKHWWMALFVRYGHVHHFYTLGPFHTSGP